MSEAVPQKSDPGWPEWVMDLLLLVLRWLIDELERRSKDE